MLFLPELGVVKIWRVPCVLEGGLWLVWILDQRISKLLIRRVGC